MTIEQSARDAAAEASGFASWEEAVYWSNLAKQNAVMQLAEAFQRTIDAAKAQQREADAELIETRFGHLGWWQDQADAIRALATDGDAK